MMLELRPYQEDAKTAVYGHLRSRHDNPCVVIPTAGGKTPVMASICKDSVGKWGGRVLILAHTKELLVQTADAIRDICPEMDYGMYSAGLRRRDTDTRVIVAGIQSVHRKACDLGRFDLVIVDEAHMIPRDGDGMYRQFLADALIVNPRLRVIGMTATPFRLKTGVICAPDGVLNYVCYEVSVAQLIHDGFLCPLVTKSSETKVDTSALHTRGGEFVTGETEQLMDEEDLVQAACTELVEQTHDRHSCLVFATGIQHGQHIASLLRRRHGIECGFVCGTTATSERDTTIGRFKAGELKYLVNVNVLTEGFNAPNIDCVALLRPTMSPGLLYQMCGRGFRLHPDKKDCLVLDFGGNVARHGPVDQVEVTDRRRGGQGGDGPVRECPSCHNLVVAGYGTCPECDHAFPPPQRQRHEAEASTASILSQDITDTEHEVRDVSYGVHTKRDAPAESPKSMRVDYRLAQDHWHSEWVCFEHSGYTRQQAVDWWRRRSPDPVPDTAERAVEIAEGGGVAITESITLRSTNGEKFDCIVRYRLGDLPEPLPTDQIDDDTEIPF